MSEKKAILFYDPSNHKQYIYTSSDIDTAFISGAFMTTPVNDVLSALSLYGSWNGKFINDNHEVQVSILPGTNMGIGYVVSTDNIVHIVSPVRMPWLEKGKWIEIDLQSQKSTTYNGPKPGENVKTKSAPMPKPGKSVEPVVVSHQSIFEDPGMQQVMNLLSSRFQAFVVSGIPRKSDGAPIKYMSCGPLVSTHAVSGHVTGALGSFLMNRNLLTQDGEESDYGDQGR